MESLCQIIQGLFIHDYYGGLLYGKPPWGDDPPPRGTLPVMRRLTDIIAAHDQSLEDARPVFERIMGTCRDFALMLCSMLRHHKIPARVRCGFASYFGGGGYEDHWLVEYWDETADHWVMADAELDEAHRQHLGIKFPISHVPVATFLPATLAWPGR